MVMVVMVVIVGLVMVVMMMVMVVIGIVGIVARVVVGKLDFGSRRLLGPHGIVSSHQRDGVRNWSQQLGV